MGFTKFELFPGDRQSREYFQDDKNRKLIQVYEWDGVNPVLGKTTHEDPDLNMEAVRADGLTVYRRQGGGGAVLLYPGVLVITAGWQKDARSPDLPGVIRRVADRIGQAVSRQNIPGVIQNGMGDICIGNRKILGSSLSQSRQAVVYQGSLLVDPDLRLIGRYLGHPSREPEYRAGRDHGEFLTCLADHGPVNKEKLIKDLEELLDGFLLYGDD